MPWSAPGTTHPTQMDCQGTSSQFCNFEEISPPPTKVTQHREKRKWTRVNLSHLRFYSPPRVGEECGAPREYDVVDDDYDPAEDYEEQWWSSFNVKPCHVTRRPCPNSNILRHKKKWQRMKMQRTVKDKYATRFGSPCGSKICIKARVYHQIVQRLLAKCDTFGHEEMLQPTRVPHLRHYNHLLHEKIYLIHVNAMDVNQVRNIWERENSPVRKRERIPTPPAPRDYATHPAHVLFQHNAPTDLEADLLTALLDLQQREVTPEDYEILLQLDTLRVAPKTVSTNQLKCWKTEKMNEELFELSAACCICQEIYQMSDEVKHLPCCEHFFHVKCIETWLSNSSQNCPLDGIPVVR